MKKTVIMTLLLLFAFPAMLTGCQKELTKEEVEETEFYQELVKENKELKNNIDALEEEINVFSKELVQLKKQNENQQSETDGNKHAADYFKKLKKSSLTMAEIGYTDDYCNPVYIRNKAVTGLISSMMAKADLTVNYTPEKLKDEMGAGYSYILYEEDNTVFEMEVYAEGYVVFSDLPGQVYYVRDADILGKAYLVRKGSYPNSGLLHRMADSSLVISGENKAWKQETCLLAANYIDSMEKEEAEQGNGQKKTKEYVFYSHGNHMSLTLYESEFSITAWDGEISWFQGTEEQLKEMKDIFS